MQNFCFSRHFFCSLRSIDSFVVSQGCLRSYTEPFEQPSEKKNFGHICLKSGHPRKYRVRRSLCKLGCRVLFCFIFATLPLLNLSTDLRRKTKTHHNVWKSLDKRSTVSLCVVVHIVKKIILVDLWVKKENSCLEFSHTWLKAFLGGDFDWEPWKRAQIEFWHPQCHKKVIRLKMPCFENCQ